MSKINENRPGYKYTPLGWIPEQWEAVRIEDVAELNPSRTILSDDEVVSFLGMADVSEEGKIVNCCIRKYGDVKNGFTYFKDGDILVAKITPCFENGKGALAKDLKNGIGFGSTEFHVIRSGEKVFPTYLFYQTRLYRFRGHGEQNMTGSAGQKRVPTDFVETYKIPLPPISEQRRIAIILSTWDEAITKTQQLIAQLQQRNKGLMQQLLTGNKRLKGFVDDWKKVSIGEILTESRIPSINNNPNKRITVRLNLKGIEKRELRGTEAEDATYYFIRSEGQFIYGKQNLHKGAFGIIPKELNGFESSQDIPAFNFKPFFSPKFFVFYLGQNNIFTSLEKYATGTGSKRIHPENLFKVCFEFPSYEEQVSITEVLEIAVAELILLEQKLSALQQQKKGLMQKLLTGEVRVKI